MKIKRFDGPGGNVTQLDVLQGMADEDLFGEIRRRNIADSELRKQLGRTKLRPTLRRVALTWLSAFTLLLVATFVYLTLSSTHVPDLLNTLVGTCIGAIAGMLTGSTDSQP